MDEQGLLTIYSLENISANGLKPSMQLVEQATAYYTERVVGVTRMYAALGASHRIDALLRCYNTDVLEEGMVVVPNDGQQYQIDAIQKIIGKDAVDITLVKVDSLYEIYTESSE